ncbi:MAG: glycosyltransferase [Clostridiaceae bacterium]
MRLDFSQNEEAVIGHLLRSICRQEYPFKLVTVFVVADNCTDSSAEIARKADIVVYERFNAVHIGKGYAHFVPYTL